MILQRVRWTQQTHTAGKQGIEYTIATVGTTLEPLIIMLVRCLQQLTLVLALVLLSGTVKDASQQLF